MCMPETNLQSLGVLLAGHLWLASYYALVSANDTRNPPGAVWTENLGKT